MFTQHVFNRSTWLMAGLVSHLIFSRWARGYEEHHGACEDAYTARIGPLHLEVNQCFVLDHQDASVCLQIPTPLRQAQSLHRASRGGWQWGKWRLGYMVCLGEEQIRQPGFIFQWRQRLPRLRSAKVPKITRGQVYPLDSNDEFPF
ncbi:MAG: hypothetical protein KJ069_29060 [Anaerolineae bacterium]|nr:hypothetical protein [Anaerolineae bacterium]